jgi:GT2 family glycosyltransferase
MTTTIVIPNWNGAEKLKKNLPQVIEVAQQEQIQQIIVVDDKSSDNSLEVLEDFPQVQVVKRSKNGGFSSCVNTGVMAVTTDLVVLLNTDAVPQKGFLKNALQHFQYEKIFSVSCRVGSGSWSWAKFEDGYFWHGMGERSDVAHQTLWSSGGGGIFRVAIWRELGGLDELFNPFYEEDLDLGYRATKRGYINIWEPESVVEHYKEPGVIATHFKKEMVAKTAQRNQLMFIWKNITSDNLFLEHRSALTKQIIKHPKYVAIFWEAFKKWPQIVRKRHIEKRQALLSDEEILSKYKINL